MVVHFCGGYAVVRRNGGTRHVGIPSRAGLVSTTESRNKWNDISTYVQINCSWSASLLCSRSVLFCFLYFIFLTCMSDKVKEVSLAF